MNPTPRSRYRLLLRACLAALPVSLIFPLVPTARAVNGTWSSFSSGTWSTTGNWSGGTVADGADFTADFSTLNISSNLTVTLNSSRTIGNLTFGDTSTPSNDWTLAQSGGSVLTLQTTAGTPTIRVNNQTATISLELAGNNGLTKEGAGALVLTGSNSYVGTTTVNAGTLTLGGGGSLNAASALAVGGGGIFNFSGAALAAQTVGGLSVNTGSGTVNNTVSGTTLTLGAITRSGSGMVNFATTTGNINTSTTNTNGIIGAWATTGSGTTLDYAVSNGAGNAITSLGAATTLPSAGPGDATTNYTLGGAQTQTANTVGNTLRYTGGANTLALGATSLGLKGLMNAGTGLLTISGTAGNPGLVTTGGLDIIGNTQGITISAVISGAGSVASGGVGATVATASTSATGLVTLSGANTYGGGTTINSGALRAATSSTALGTGDVTVANGAQLQLHGGVSIANTININGTSALFSTTSSGTPNLTGIVNLQSNSSISLATNSGNAAMTLSGTVNLNGNTLSVNTNNGQTPSVTISAAINGSGGITKNLAGDLLISADNSSSYSGTTTLSAGGLALGSNGALGSGTFSLGANSATVTVRSSNTSARTVSNALVLLGTTAPVYAFGSSNVSLNGNLTFSNTGAIAMGTTTRTFQVLNVTEFAGAFTGSGGITKTGAGTLQLNGANTYTGATTITAGTLALGANNVFAVSNFSLGGGTLGVGTFTNTAVGTLALTGNSTITLGSGGAFAFADSDALNWGSNTLSITGTFLDGFSIRFGTDATGLTSGQLALISINGGAASINSSGYLVASAIPEPATYAALAGLGVLGLAATRRRRTGV